MGSHVEEMSKKWETPSRLIVIIVDKLPPHLAHLPIPEVGFFNMASYFRSSSKFATPVAAARPTPTTLAPHSMRPKTSKAFFGGFAVVREGERAGALFTPPPPGGVSAHGPAHTTANPAATLLKKWSKKASFPPFLAVFRVCRRAFGRCS